MTEFSDDQKRIAATAWMNRALAAEAKIERLQSQLADAEQCASVEADERRRLSEQLAKIEYERDEWRKQHDFEHQEAVDLLRLNEDLRSQLVSAKDLLKTFVAAYERQDSDNFTNQMRNAAYAAADLFLTDEQGRS